MITISPSRPVVSIRMPLGQPTLQRLEIQPLVRVLL